jgi:transcription elongation factor GreA
MSEDSKIYVTEEGLKKLQDEYDNLVHVVREEVKAELAEARSLGDLSENADYDAARDRQSEVESRIVELEDMLQQGHYEIINTKKGGKKTVRIGTTVTLEFMDTKEKATYTILGSNEADPLNGKLSNETPLAGAIMDARVGDVRDVEIAKPYQVKIIAID